MQGTSKLLRVSTHLLKYDREMTLTRLQVLLIVAQSKAGEGMLVRDIVTRTGLNQSTVARILSHLGQKPLRGHKHPLDWVTMVPDHEDPRRVRCQLTKKGMTVLAEIDQLI
jgi:DNA-binding MarR family transcriptional regulator